MRSLKTLATKSLLWNVRYGIQQELVSPRISPHRCGRYLTEGNTRFLID